MRVSRGRSEVLLDTEESNLVSLAPDGKGGVYAGGVARITPLEVLSYILPDTVEIPSLIPAGPVTWKNRPFDLDADR